MLDIEKTIRKIMIDESVTVTELAKRIDNSTSNLSNKLRRNNLYTSDLEKIAEALGYDLKIEFIKKES
jgi:DNA-binding Xre family transcriptional regulator|nr:MAG TPA: Regulatory protein [Caudoviricetes sp.]